MLVDHYHAPRHSLLYFFDAQLKEIDRIISLDLPKFKLEVNYIDSNTTEIQNLKF